MTRVYEELVDFIAGGATSSEVAEWVPSAETRAEVEDLLEAEKSGELTPQQRADLNHYLELEHLMRLAKARARRGDAHA
jgi:hypothetical protein